MKTRTGKSLVEMNSSELIDEIAHLRTTLERVVVKNKRRKKALKELNKFAVLNNKLMTDLVTRNENQRRMVEEYKARAETAERFVIDQASAHEREFRAAAVHMAGLETQNEVYRHRHGVNHNLPNSYSGGQITGKPEKVGFWKRLFGRTHSARQS